MFIKKKKKPNIVNPKDTKIPIFQKIRQNLGFFFEIFLIKLLSFLVLNKIKRGKNKLYASFLFFNMYTNMITIIQKINDMTNQGFRKKSIIRLSKLMKNYFIAYLFNKAVNLE